MRLKPKTSLALISVLLLVVALACRAVIPSDRPVSEVNPGESPTSNESTTVDVVLEEFAVKLDGNPAKAGDVTFIVRNEGNMPHDFALSGEGVSEKTPMLQPGESATLEVTLQPGSYEYICTVAGHVMLGMQGEFTVPQ